MCQRLLTFYARDQTTILRQERSLNEYFRQRALAFNHCSMCPARMDFDVSIAMDPRGQQHDRRHQLRNFPW
jgi:hypothetical protein